MTRFMNIVSGVFHPLLMATYCCLIFFFFDPDVFSPIQPAGIIFFILAVFVTTALIPGLSVLFLKLTSRVSSLEITRMEERSLPFISIGAFYGITTYMFYTRMHVPIMFIIIMVAITCLILLLFLISFWFKISVHSSAIWGMTGLLTAYNIKYVTSGFEYIVATLFVCSGITTASRLYLKRHSPAESWAGVFLGFCLCFVSFMIFG